MGEVEHAASLLVEHRYVAFVEALYNAKRYGCFL